MAIDDDVMTPYSTIKPLLDTSDIQYWVPELDRDRIAAYQKYEEIYWNVDSAFKLVQRGLDDHPIYVPNPRTIVDSTSHFWAKGLQLQSKGATQVALDKLLKRETFYSKFHTAKHSGVVRGDFVLHLTADPAKPAGMRLSINSVDPASYFPEFDDDDLDRINAVNLVEQIIDPADPNAKPKVRRLRYDYVIEGGKRRVRTQEATFEVRDWWKSTRVQLTSISPERLLPERITTIPVYAIKNLDWQGQPFGSSELRGFERVQAGINQAITDEELALALDGLGVYATDAPQPTNSQGAKVEWEISPGRVVEMPIGSLFKRVEGLSTVKPYQDHLEFLVASMYESAGTFRGGTIDATIAESGIALAIRFLPTQAKLEQRDQAIIDRLNQMFFDWSQWHFIYEDDVVDAQVDVILGDKLPTDKKDFLNMLNNALDRDAISKAYYRTEVGKLYGLVIPDNMDTEIEEEKKRAAELAPKPAGVEEDPGGGLSQQDGRTQPKANASNNKNAPNESEGNEA